ARGNLLVFSYQGAEVQPLLPGAHGVSLHQAVGVFTRHAAFGEVEQKLPAEDQAARALEVFQHAVRVDKHPVNQVRGLVQQVVEQDGGVGQNDPLDGRM